MKPLRIYADFNGLVAGPVHPEHTAVVLDTYGSARDLAAAGVALSDGLPLVAWDASDEVEDLEGHGQARYDQTHRRWVVEFDELGVRYVPAGDRREPGGFTCVTCRTVFDQTPLIRSPDEKTVDRTARIRCGSRRARTRTASRLPPGCGRIPDDVLAELIASARLQLGEFEDGTPLPGDFRVEHVTADRVAELRTVDRITSSRLQRPPGARPGEVADALDVVPYLGELLVSGGQLTATPEPDVQALVRELLALLEPA